FHKRNARTPARSNGDRGIFPWTDVVASRREPKRHHPEGKAVPPPRVTATTCPCCSEPLTWIYFSTPPRTWEQKCGQAGCLGTCDECHFAAGSRVGRDELTDFERPRCCEPNEVTEFTARSSP